ncbi:hypothetical protein O3G_MSEX011203, partial [Manduca sexta]
MSSVRRFFCLF